MRRFVLFAPLVLAAALLLVPAAAQGQAQALRLDQSQLIYDTDSDSLYGPYLAGQTFTAGVTGNLTQVRLVLSLYNSPTANLTVGIYATSGGAPSGSALGTGSVPVASVTAIPGWVSVTISPVPVRAGTQYAIVLSDPSDSLNGYVVSYATTNLYAGGKVLVSNDGGLSWSTDSFLDTLDLAFQTYVSSSSQNGQGQNGNGQGQNH